MTSFSVALCFVLWVGPGAAEIFKWKDDQGRLHFAQDLSQVPERFRTQARGTAFEEGSGSVVQRYKSSPAAPSPRSRALRSRRSTTSADTGKTYRIRVQKTGSTMRVNVRLNDRVTAPFYVDTGASDVVLPESVARELGLELLGARTAIYGTANGNIQQSLVTLDSVDLGGARAEKVPASVSKTMSTGLLGLSFFNHFKYHFDPGSGVITLQSNGLVEEGKIRGGRSAAQWRNQFYGLTARREAIEQALEDSKSGRSRRKVELKEAIGEVERQIAILESEADNAHVPMQWRD
jgi:clan AA aspartic protease (TIGR02281 family)